MDPQPLSRALCCWGSRHCYTVTVLIVVLSDLTTKRQKPTVGLLGVSLRSRQTGTHFKREWCPLKCNMLYTHSFWWLLKMNSPQLLLFLMMSMCWERLRSPCWSLECVKICRCLAPRELCWLDYRESDSRCPDQCVIFFTPVTRYLNHQALFKIPTGANNQHKAYLHVWGHICMVNSACCRHVCAKAPLQLSPPSLFLINGWIICPLKCSNFPEPIKMELIFHRI